MRCLRDRRRADRALGGSSIVERLHGLAGPAPSERALELDRRRWAFCWAAGEIEREVEAKTWRAFWLTSVEGVAAAQAAEELGMNVGAVYAARCRVLARLRQRVQEICEKNP